MKRFIIPMLSTCVMCACRNVATSNNDRESADSLNTEIAESRGEFATADLAMNSLFGNVNCVYVYYDTADSTGAVTEKIDVPSDTITFDANGMITSGVGSFHGVKYEVTRDDNGKIIKAFGKNDDIEETIVYKYKGNLLAESRSDAFCELSGAHDSKYSYDDNGQITKIVTEGNSDEVMYKHVTTYKYIEYDKKGNWTRAFVVSDCTETIDDEESTYTTYENVRRKISYY